jgi:hypothetical protein
LKKHIKQKTHRHKNTSVTTKRPEQIDHAWNFHVQLKIYGAIEGLAYTHGSECHWLNKNLIYDMGYLV